MDSWIETQKRLLNSTSLQEELMKHIKIHLCYVNANDEIIELKTIKHKSNQISESEMYKLVHTHKKQGYTFVEMSSFIAQKFEDTEFKTYSMVTGIEFPPSLFVYHDINCLLFLYKEKPATSKSTKRVRFAPMKNTRKRG